MIQIEDYDSPIIAANKIINGTRKANAFEEACRKAFFPNISPANAGKDMFRLEEIKEIAGHLEVYYESHIDGD